MAIEIRKNSAVAAERSLPRTNKLSELLNKNISFGSKGLNDRKKERFYSELRILFSSGVDIRSALELLGEEQSKEHEKKMYAEIRSSVISGDSFSEALHRTGRFSDYEYYSLKIGEESGKLNEVLLELNNYFSGKIRQKRLLTKALSYPVLLFLTSIGAIAFMLSFVVPMFSDVFKRFKGDLPYFTKVIIGLSHSFSRYFSWFLLVALIMAIVIHTQKKKSWYRRLTSDVLLRIPVVKDLVSRIYLARFCQSMQLLIASRTPLINAIDLVKKMIGFYPIEMSLEMVREDVMKGKTLYESLSRYPIYNKRLLSLIRVAEEVNQLDKMFERLASQYADEVEHQITILSSLVEPLMILFLGVIITLILIAMYLPMFKLGSVVG
jgi:type IV pilus assembly protein PilC